MQKKTYGFTLIEMLIVIVIIGILASALVPRLTSIQGRARDTKRKVDMKTIYNANEIYLVDNGQYHPAASALKSTQTQPWMSLLTGVLTSIPVDPINVGSSPSTTGEYLYFYTSVYTSPNTYWFEARLENTKDPDRCEVKSYKYRNGSTYGNINCAAPYTQRYFYDPSQFANGQF